MTPAPLNELWVYLATSPLLGLTLTLLAYQAAHHVYQRSGQHHSPTRYSLPSPFWAVCCG